MPNIAPDGPLETEKKSILSPVGDVVGQVLDKGLTPIGQLTKQVGEPSGEALRNVEKQIMKEKGYSDKIDHNKPDSELPGGERIGGNAQTGKNPLGL